MKKGDRTVQFIARTAIGIALVILAQLIGKLLVQGLRHRFALKQCRFCLGGMLTLKLILMSAYEHTIRKQPIEAAYPNIVKILGLGRQTPVFLVLFRHAAVGIKSRILYCVVYRHKVGVLRAEVL